ncbi:hypothetical protein FACS1894217_10540 [Clostridia bacterium]|nr:hypothetical protein FACS1894217_10540 [Clostridia bacterium]
MNEHTSVTRDAAPPVTLAENQYVQELFSILKDNGRDTSGLSALLGHVEGMENYIKRAEDKISDMKSQLADMKEVQNHPVKTALTNAIKTLENKVAEVKVQLAELKQNIVDGCKSAVQAFKEKGLSTLNNLASFFHIKGAIKAIDRSVGESAQSCDKAVERINSFAREYHSANNALRNMGRIVVGKPPIDAKKEAGKLARAVAAPYKAEKTVLLKISGLANSMVQRLEQLETTAAKQRKPPIAERIARGKERAAQRELERPTPERAKTTGLEV